MLRDHLPRILLIEPPFYRLYKDTYSLQRFPLSLSYLGGEIKSHTSWEVMAYNADFHPETESMKFGYLSGEGFQRYLAHLHDPNQPIWNEIRKTIEAFKPDVVGISAKSQNFASARIVAGLVKAINPETVVIVGGPHSSMKGAELLDNPEIDICVKGEGERTIIELLEALEKGSPLDTVAGIAYRNSGVVLETAEREQIENLDSLVHPHEHAREILKDYEQYPLTGFSNIFTIRGCPYNCFFCGSRNIWTRRPRFRSPESVAKEIQGLQQMGILNVNFADDTFGVSSGHIAALCKTIKERCPGVHWSCEMPVALITDANLGAMRDAGCATIAIGIESGNNEILKAIRKNLLIEDALEACKRVKRFGLGVHVFFIVGFPQDTEATIQDTFDAIGKVNCDSISYSIFTPYPGTEAFDHCVAEGLIGEDYDVSLYNHQSPANHFCKAVTADRFRELAGVIERAVDRKNARMKVRRLFSMQSVRRLREAGLAKGLRKGLQVLRGR